MTLNLLHAVAGALISKGYGSCDVITNGGNTWEELMDVGIRAVGNGGAVRITLTFGYAGRAEKTAQDAVPVYTLADLPREDLKPPQFEKHFESGDFL